MWMLVMIAWQTSGSISYQLSRWRGSQAHWPGIIIDQAYNTESVDLHYGKLQRPSKPKTKKLTQTETFCSWSHDRHRIRAGQTKLQRNLKNMFQINIYQIRVTADGRTDLAHELPLHCIHAAVPVRSQHNVCCSQQPAANRNLASSGPVQCNHSAQRSQ
ncbi:uncharacterized protein BDV14DRAFT_12753 [Aspergillus stella-maris]|uniref:uncharacterized protein n=1 Tax=Aspergillus stella-maris TaxID=1810926 RepID=UPI003CCD37BC